MTKKRTERTRQPAFPGFEKCMWMMRRHDPMTKEEGFHALRPHASEHVEQLISEFKSESNGGLKAWLLDLIGETRSEMAFDLLVDQLDAEDESLRFYAILGLVNLGSRRARQALWEAGDAVRAEAELTLGFLESIDYGNGSAVPQRPWDAGELHEWVMGRRDLRGLPRP